MTPIELQALEKIQSGDIKSAMDQIKYLIIQNNQTQANLTKIFQELDTKINLQSEYLTALDPVLKIGSGTVSATGINVIGVGTLFTREISIGNSIKIGTETQVVATIVDDFTLTVGIAFVAVSTNQVYGILKLITKELLTGNFEFGETNGSLFNGIINQNSVFQHYGRMTDDHDLINVQYAKRLSTPALIRAANSILRTGDTVGNSSLVYEYIFKNVNWTFDTASSVYYNGPITDPNHIVTLAKLNEVQTSIQQAMFATWNTLASTGANFTVGSNPVKSRVGPSIVPDNQLNFDTYFSNETAGLTLKAGVIPTGKTGIIVTVSASARTSHNMGADIYQGNCGIYKNNTLIAESRTSFDGPTGFSAQPLSSVSAVITLVPGDVLVVGINYGDGCIGSTDSVSQYLSIAKIGIY